MKPDEYPSGFSLYFVTFLIKKRIIKYKSINLKHMKILLVLTFVYGVLRLLTHSKLFTTHLVGLLESITVWKKDRWYNGLIIWLDMLFFYFSLCYQVYFWIFSKINL